MSSSVNALHRRFADQGLVRADRKILGGVSGGIATRLGTDVWAVRLAFVVLAILVDPAPLLYLLLWVLMPNRGAVARAFETDGIAPAAGPVPTANPAPPADPAPTVAAQLPQYPTDAVAAQPLDLNKRDDAASGQ